MSRTISALTLVWLVVATLHVAAQAPGSTARIARGSRHARAGIDAADTAGHASRCVRHDPGQRADLDERRAAERLRPPARCARRTDRRDAGDRSVRALRVPFARSGQLHRRDRRPGSDSVLAASQVLNVGAGEAVSAVVKLPFRIPPFGGPPRRLDAVGRRRHLAGGGLWRPGDAGFGHRDLRATCSSRRCESRPPVNRVQPRRQVGFDAPRRRLAPGRCTTPRTTRSTFSIDSPSSIATGASRSRCSSWHRPR